MVQENTVNDFSKGSVVKNILTLALPMTLAQLINILYNIVDRMYIGRIPDHATLSLTGLGLSIASEILQRMGESISVSSVPGQTTTFSFTLPVYDAEQHKAEEQD